MYFCIPLVLIFVSLKYILLEIYINLEFARFALQRNLRVNSFLNHVLSGSLQAFSPFEGNVFEVFPPSLLSRSVAEERIHFGSDRVDKFSIRKLT